MSGITTDTNMSNMLEFFNAHSDQSPASGNDFWAASGIKPTQSVSQHYKYKIDPTTLAEPSLGDYKLAYLN